MNGRVWGLKLSLLIKTDCICGLTYKALPKLDLFILLSDKNLSKA